MRLLDYSSHFYVSWSPEMSFEVFLDFPELSLDYKLSCVKVYSMCVSVLIVNLPSLSPSLDESEWLIGESSPSLSFLGEWPKDLASIFFSNFFSFYLSLWCSSVVFSWSLFFLPFFDKFPLMWLKKSQFIAMWPLQWQW